MLSVRGEFEGYANEVAQQLRARGLRASTESADEPLGARVRRAKLDKIPYILVVGAEDAGNRTVGVNRCGAADPERGVSLDDLVARLADEVARRGAPEDL